MGGESLHDAHPPTLPVTDASVQPYPAPTRSDDVPAHDASGSSEKELSLKELERLLQTSQPDVAGIASRLEKKGLVSRFQDAADRRVKRLSITTQGEQSCCAARGEIRSGEDALLAGMTPEEQNAFRRLLEKAAQNLT